MDFVVPVVNLAEGTRPARRISGRSSMADPALCQSWQSCAGVPELSCPGLRRIVHPDRVHGIPLREAAVAQTLPGKCGGRKLLQPCGSADAPREFARAEAICVPR